MKKLCLFFLVIITICGLALTSCKNDIQGPPAEPIADCSPNVDTMFKWFVFRYGSYWIYREQTTGELDTVTVTGCNMSNSVGGWRAFNMATVSSYEQRRINYYFNESFQFKGEAHTQCDRFPIGRSKYGINTLDGDGWVLFYPFIDGEFMTTGDAGPNGIIQGKTYIEQKFQHYELPGENVISNVVRFYCTMDETNEHLESRYDFAKNIGLVRKEHSRADGSKEVWELIEKYVVQ